MVVVVVVESDSGQTRLLLTGFVWPSSSLSVLRQRLSLLILVSPLSGGKAIRPLGRAPSM